MKVESIKLTDLKEYPNNSRKHLPRNLKAIRASLEAHGQLEPLLVQKSSNKVIGGNGRLKVMRELGWESAFVLMHDCSDAEADKLNVIMNRTAELAVWDEPVLAGILRQINPEEYALIGFDDTEVQALLDSTDFSVPDLPDIDIENGEKPARSLVQYTLIFDNAEQQERFQDFLKKLKKHYPNEETHAARLDRHIREIG